jgi:hypothetical protein
VPSTLSSPVLSVGDKVSLANNGMFAFRALFSASTIVLFQRE